MRLLFDASSNVESLKANRWYAGASANSTGAVAHHQSIHGTCENPQIRRCVSCDPRSGGAGENRTTAVTGSRLLFVAAVEFNVACIRAFQGAPSGFPKKGRKSE